MQTNLLVMWRDLLLLEGRMTIMFVMVSDLVIR